MRHRITATLSLFPENAHRRCDLQFTKKLKTAINLTQRLEDAKKSNSC
jgi:hypothetical protein